MGELVVSGPELGRVLLGRLFPEGLGSAVGNWIRPGSQSPPLAAPTCYGVLVVGPSRSGKSTSLLIPAVARWEGPLVATSIRSDVVAKTWEIRAGAEWPTLIYNPANQGGYGSNTWSPLTGARTWAGARRTARALIDAAGLAEGGAVARQDYWNAAAGDYLAPLLLAAASDGPSMEPVMRWLNRGDRAADEVGSRLTNQPDALAAAEAVWKTSARLRDSIYTTARVSLSAYEDPEVMATCLGVEPGAAPDITPETVLGSGASLYIVSPPVNWDYFAPLFVALLTSIIDHAYQQAALDGGMLRPPLLLALDEVANIAPIRDLPQFSSTAAGSGIQLITVLQDLGQAERIWGPEGTRTLVANHYARLVLGGTADGPTLEWMQDMLGEMDVERVTRNRDNFGGRTGSARTVERRPVATAAEIRQMPRGTALLIAGSHPAARVLLREGTTI